MDNRATAIVEATGLVRDDLGNLMLVAAGTNGTPSLYTIQNQTTPLLAVVILCRN
jgi:hypothetical protein